MRLLTSREVLWALFVTTLCVRRVRGMAALVVLRALLALRSSLRTTFVAPWIVLRTLVRTLNIIASLGSLFVRRLSRRRVAAYPLTRTAERHAFARRTFTAALPCGLRVTLLERRTRRTLGKTRTLLITCVWVGRQSRRGRRLGASR